LRFSVLIVSAVLISGFGAWLINPGLFISASSDTSAYAEQKSRSANKGQAGLTARPLSIEEAYGRIPHARTPFRSDLAQMSEAEKSYLQALFGATDRGVVERVFVQDQLYQGSRLAFQGSNYDILLEQVMSLPTPVKLMPVETLIYEAIEEQRHYLIDWGESADSRYFSPHAALVQSSHKKAHRRL
jgi:hypothetical protein